MKYRIVALLIILNAHCYCLCSEAQLNNDQWPQYNRTVVSKLYWGKAMEINEKIILFQRGADQLQNSKKTIHIKHIIGQEFGVDRVYSATIKYQIGSKNPAIFFHRFNQIKLYGYTSNKNTPNVSFFDKQAECVKNIELSCGNNWEYPHTSMAQLFDNIEQFMSDVQQYQKEISQFNCDVLMLDGDREILLYHAQELEKTWLAILGAYLSFYQKKLLPESENQNQYHHEYAVLCQGTIDSMFQRTLTMINNRLKALRYNFKEHLTLEELNREYIKKYMMSLIEYDSLFNMMSSFKDFNNLEFEHKSSSKPIEPFVWNSKNQEAIQAYQDGSFLSGSLQFSQE